jgi:hypothetical protein
LCSDRVGKPQIGTRQDRTAIGRFRPKTARFNAIRERRIEPWSVFKTAAIDHSATPPRCGIRSIERLAATIDFTSACAFRSPFRSARPSHAEHASCTARPLVRGVHHAESRTARLWFQNPRVRHQLRGAYTESAVAIVPLALFQIPDPRSRIPDNPGSHNPPAIPGAVVSNG